MSYNIAMVKIKKKKPTKDSKKLKKRPMKKLGLSKYIDSNRTPRKRRDLLEDTKSQLAVVRQNDKSLSLVERCKMKMSSSMLRLIDEDLYKNDTKSVSIDKDKFVAYHEAYASVREKWPVQPIDYLIKFIKKRILPHKPHHKLRFADIGCGKEPLLKINLPPKVKVVSFDLVSTHPDVIEANMENLPIESNSIDCAVYSLSLMAKNLGNVILEGKRLLKIGGSMLIVEVTSRFEGGEKRFIGRMEKLGFKLKSVQALEPNKYFTFFHFSKKDSNTDYNSSALSIQLKPCIYKVR